MSCSFRCGKKNGPSAFRSIRAKLTRPCRFCLQRYGLTNVAEINTVGVKLALEVSSIHFMYRKQTAPQHVHAMHDISRHVLCARGLMMMSQAVAESGKGIVVAGAVGPTGMCIECFCGEEPEKQKSRALFLTNMLLTTFRHAYMMYTGIEAWTHCVFECVGKQYLCLCPNTLCVCVSSCVRACVRACVRMHFVCLRACARFVYVRVCARAYMHTHSPFALTYTHPYAPHVYTYTNGVHACAHTCIHTCIHTYMHTYIHTYTHIHTYIHTCMHACVYTCRRRSRIYR
jgi:hypothetical protein